MLRAAEAARSLFEPIMKLSRVYFELRPLEVVWVLTSIGLMESLIGVGVAVISRGRTLDLDLV